MSKVNCLCEFDDFGNLDQKWTELVTKDNNLIII